nr:hypothetical protein [Eubacterium sp.]
MRASESTYKNVAKHCSAYSAKDCCKNTVSNKSGDVSVSCTTCKHFSDDGKKHCKLDLFDPIVADHNF